MFKCNHRWAQFDEGNDIVIKCQKCGAYREDKNIPIELTLANTITEWFAELPLYDRARIYVNYNKPRYLHVEEKIVR